MQFKKVGKRIQVVAYAGYDREKKRAKVTMLGSMCQRNLKPKPELIAKLTPAQKEELQAYIDKHRQSREIAELEQMLAKAPNTLREIAECITSEIGDVNQEWANQIYASIDNLTKVMRRNGMERPPKEVKKTDFMSTKNQTSFCLE